MKEGDSCPNCKRGILKWTMEDLMCNNKECRAYFLHSLFSESAGVAETDIIPVAYPKHIEVDVCCPKCEEKFKVKIWGGMGQYENIDRAK